LTQERRRGVAWYLGKCGRPRPICWVVLATSVRCGAVRSSQWPPAVAFCVHAIEHVEILWRTFLSIAHRFTPMSAMSPRNAGKSWSVARRSSRTKTLAPSRSIRISSGAALETRSKRCSKPEQLPTLDANSEHVAFWFVGDDLRDALSCTLGDSERCGHDMRPYSGCISGIAAVHGSR
jgi:hypothetical protein